MASLVMQIHMALPPETVRRLDFLARRNKKTRTAFVKTMVKNYGVIDANEVKSMAKTINGIESFRFKGDKETKMFLPPFKKIIKKYATMRV